MTSWNPQALPRQPSHSTSRAIPHMLLWFNPNLISAPATFTTCTNPYLIGPAQPQEDAHTILMDLGSPGQNGGGSAAAGNTSQGQHGPLALFGVFDGHSGKEVAAFCAQHLVRAPLRLPFLLLVLAVAIAGA